MCERARLCVSLYNFRLTVNNHEVCCGGYVEDYPNTVKCNFQKSEVKYGRRANLWDDSDVM